jgi:protein-S-isoprenylcysteine O-methyltransferase Ste14
MAWARRIIPPGWLLIGLLAVFALHHFWPLVQLFRPPLNWLGVPFICVGLALAAGGVGAFRLAGTSVIPFARSTTLVTTGVYRLTRNPMYLGLTLILGGTAWLLGSLGALLPVPPFIALLQSAYVGPEERFLQDIFGSDYARYKTRVRRWI